MDAGLRGVALGAAATLTVLGAYTLGGARAATTESAAATGAPGVAGAAAASAGTPEAGPGTLTLRGTGESTGVPDQLTFRLSVRQEADDVTTALDRASAAMRRVLAALARAEVRRKDVQSTGLSLRPDYDYSSSGPPVLTGYVATESVSVLVRDLRLSGRAISAATTAGGNAVRLSGLGLRIGDRDGLLEQARDAAVADALAKAEQYAAATGQSLGPVLSVREVRARGGAPVQLSSRNAALDARAAVPVRAGSKELAVTVAVVWSLG